MWNDLVNLMSYVTYVFPVPFRLAAGKAEKLMMDAHARDEPSCRPGRGEKMEIDTEALQGFGLWATFQKDH